MGDSSSSTKQSQTNTLNPWSQQQYQNVSGQVQNTLNGNYQGSYTPYTGALTAGQTPLQQTANNLGLLNVGSGQGYLSQAGQGASSGASYSPSTVSPQALSTTNLSAYMNPYTQDVTNATMNALNLQNQQALNNEANQFTSDGAFGGARQGVADAQTNALYGNIAAQTLAGLNQSNYANAQSAAQNDIQNNLTGQLANQSAGLQGANLNLNASGLLGNLGSEQQNLGLNDTNELAALGAAQQGTNQQYLSNLYNNYLLGQITPSQQAQLQLGLLGETPMLQNSTGTSNTTTSASPLSAGLGLLGGIGNLFSGGGNSAVSGLLRLSDERTKENVVTLGHDRKGRRWVEFSYRNEAGRHVGVMAQEVQKTDPAAVVEHPLLGLFMVDYAKLAEAA